MGLLDAVLPPACGSCGSFGALICGRCRGSFRPPGDPANRFVAADPGIIVGGSFTVAAAAFAYEGSVRRTLQKLKYGGVARLADVLAAAALPAFRDVLVESGAGAALVAVPVHPDRRRERGYNQAELLARALGRRSGLRVADVLARTRSTTKQHHLNRAARLANLASAFALRPGVERAPPVVVVVDDIITTSATLEACASVLLASGSERVYGLAIAREV